MAGRGSSHRSEQVAEAIRETIAKALVHGELRDPRIGLVTVSHVEVSRDLSQATIYVVPHGDADEKAAAVAGLQGAAGYLRRLVAQELTTRIAPTLHIRADRGLEHAQEIERILATLRPSPSEDLP